MLTPINAGAITTVGGNVTIDLSLDATSRASALGGRRRDDVIDDVARTTVILGSSRNDGTLTITRRTASFDRGRRD